MVKSLKYFLSLQLLFFAMCISPVQQEDPTLDLSNIDENTKLALIDRIQKEVNQKYPFQGSLIHQSKCDTLIQLNHNISGALQEKSTPSTKIGDYHIAFPLLEEAANIDPSSLYYYSWLLVYYFRDYERAIQRLEEFDELTPNQVDYAWGENVNYLKGLAYKQQGQYKKAIKEFTDAIDFEKSGTDAYTFVYRGISYLKNNNFQLAVSDFDIAIKENKNCTAAYFWKAESLLKLGRKGEAFDAFQKALTLLKKGIFKDDSYVHFFDIPTIEQVNNRLKEAFQ